MRSDVWATVVVALIGAVATIAAGALGYSSGSKAVTKDYVQLAVSTLGNKDASPELRKWSVDVLKALSPVPFGAKLEKELVTGGLYRQRLLVQKLDIPAVLAVRCPDLLKGTGKSVPETKALEVMRRYDECRLRLDYLLQLVQKYNEIADQANAEQARIDANFEKAVSK